MIEVIHALVAFVAEVETEIAETTGFSQATVSRAITALTPLLGRALARLIRVAEDVDLTQSVIVDGRHDTATLAASALLAGQDTRCGWSART